MSLAKRWAITTAI